jgi:hypothetical protein
MECWWTLEPSVGFHPNLLITVQPTEIRSPCGLAIELELSSLYFIDPYTLPSTLVPVGISPAQIDTESSSITIKPTATRSLTLTIYSDDWRRQHSIPLHMRYGAPSNPSFVDVVIQSPKSLQLCADGEKRKVHILFFT